VKSAPLEEKPSIRALLRAAPAPVRFVLLGVFVNQFGAFAESFLVLYLLNKGYDARLASLSLAAFSAGTIAGTVIGSELVARVGPKLAIVFSMGATAVAVGLIPVFASTGVYAAVLAASLFSGVCSQAYRPASSLLLTALMPESMRAASFSLMRVALNIGAAAAPLSAAVLVLVDWDLLYLANAVAAAMFCVIAWFGLPRRLLVASREGEAVASARQSPYRTLLVDRPFLVYLSGMLFSGLVFAQTFATLPVMLENQARPTWTYSLILVLGSLTLIFFELPVTFLIGRWPRVTAAAVGTAIFGSVFAFLAIPYVAIWLVVVICVISAAGTSISAPTLWSHPSYAPEPVRAHYLGVSQAAFGVGVALGPIVGVALYSAIGLSAWIVVGLLGLMSAWAGALGVGRSPGTGSSMRLRVDGSEVPSTTG